MTSERGVCDGTHEWQPYSTDELKALRSQARADRPPGAWIDSASRCERCGRTEARVAWFGQVHEALIAPKPEGGPAVVHWPSRP
jgi:hypothetical protein